MEKIIMEFPVPSCKISRLIWDEKEEKWLYEYQIINKSNILLKDNNEKELYVYSHISNLTITDRVNEGSINITVKNLNDIKELMKKQSKEDMLYREKWIKDHPNYFDNVLKYETENITHEPKYRYIISVLSQDKDKTVFIVAY